MKSIEISKATESLSHYVKWTRQGPVVLTSKGRAVAMLVPADELEVENYSLSTNPEFIAMIEDSRARHKAEGGLTEAEVRRRLSAKKSA